MADWVDAYHELRTALGVLSSVSMGCRVETSRRLKPSQVALSDFAFESVFDADGKFLYTTMVPKKIKSDG